ncbi:hypothetical protein SK128_026030, partial [Halocaridina rubra]
MHFATIRNVNDTNKIRETVRFINDKIIQRNLPMRLLGTELLEQLAPEAIWNPEEVPQQPTKMGFLKSLPLLGNYFSSKDDLKYSLQGLRNIEGKFRTYKSAAFGKVFAPSSLDIPKAEDILKDVNTDDGNVIKYSILVAALNARQMHVKLDEELNEEKERNDDLHGQLLGKMNDEKMLKERLNRLNEEISMTKEREADLEDTNKILKIENEECKGKRDVLTETRALMERENQQLKAENAYQQEVILQREKTLKDEIHKNEDLTIMMQNMEEEKQRKIETMTHMIQNMKEEEKQKTETMYSTFDEEMQKKQEIISELEGNVNKLTNDLRECKDSNAKNYQRMYDTSLDLKNKLETSNKNSNLLQEELSATIEVLRSDLRESQNAKEKILQDRSNEIKNLQELLASANTKCDLTESEYQQLKVVNSKQQEVILQGENKLRDEIQKNEGLTNMIQNMEEENKKTETMNINFDEEMQKKQEIISGLEGSVHKLLNELRECKDSNKKKYQQLFESSVSLKNKLAASNKECEVLRSDLTECQNAKETIQQDKTNEMDSLKEMLASANKKSELVESEYQFEVLRSDLRESQNAKEKILQDRSNEIKNLQELLASANTKCELTESEYQQLKV